MNCGQTTDATRWHKLILGLKADELKMALADMPVVDFSVFSTNNNAKQKIRLHYLAMGTGETKILFHLKTLTFCCWLVYFLVWQAKKKFPLSCHDILPTAKSETIFFQGLAGKKPKKPPSRMTFLAAVKSETRIFLKLALGLDYLSNIV